ncbi:multicopper oxidase [Ramaria rubella]|nr:multicopper oxidase [Ramaria rubella]
MTVPTRRPPLPLLVLVLTVALLTPLAYLALGCLPRPGPLIYTTPSPARVPAFPLLQPQTEDAFVLRGVGRADAETRPRTRVYNFTVGSVQGAVDGVERRMLVVNGIYPGPTIEANQEDRLVVHVRNDLEEGTSIHWHGLFQNGTNYYDGTAGITECGIPPGGSLTYNFTFGEFSGTTWWQCVLSLRHSTQYTDGVSGALIVHPTVAHPLGLPTWDEELVVQMADWYHDVSGVLLKKYLAPGIPDLERGFEPVPDGGTINGLGQYGSGGAYSNFTFQRNKAYRLRLANTGSFASIRFSIDAHPLTLIEADGTLLTPTTVSSVTLAVAQRYSVLVRANATGNGTYWMRATLQSDMFKYTQYGQNLDIRGVVRYADVSAVALPGDPSSPNPGSGTNAPDVDGRTVLVPLVRDVAPEATRAHRIMVSFQKTSDDYYLGFMNRTSWEFHRERATLLEVHKNPLGYAPAGASIAPGDQFIVTEDEIQVVDIRVDNLDDGDHPFHLHGHRPWIMGTGRGRYIGQALSNTNLLRRDTVLIPRYSWMVLRFVTDNPGLWTFHCHLVWHNEAGLLMQFNSLPSKVAQWEIPGDIVAQCAKAAGRHA